MSEAPPPHPTHPTPSLIITGSDDFFFVRFSRLFSHLTGLFARLLTQVNKVTDRLGPRRTSGRAALLFWEADIG